MADEKFTTLIPQHTDSPEIVRLKHAKAAALLVEPAETTVSILTCYPLEVLDDFGGGGNDWRPVVPGPVWFRKALIWGAALDGSPNTAAIQLRHGTNANRNVNPGEMIVIEAPPGQKLNLQNVLIIPAYVSDCLTFELY